MLFLHVSVEVRWIHHRCSHRLPLAPCYSWLGYACNTIVQQRMATRSQRSSRSERAARRTRAQCARQFRSTWFVEFNEICHFKLLTDPEARRPLPLQNSPYVAYSRWARVDKEVSYHLFCSLEVDWSYTRYKYQINETLLMDTLYSIVWFVNLSVENCVFGSICCSCRVCLFVEWLIECSEGTFLKLRLQQSGQGKCVIISNFHIIRNASESVSWLQNHLSINSICLSLFQGKD